MNNPKRNRNQSPPTPLTRQQLDTLLEVVEGELRGLFLLILLLGRPARDIVQLKTHAVLPLIRELAGHFASVPCRPASDDLLLPGLAALPPDLLFDSDEARDAVDRLPRMVAVSIAQVEATAHATSRRIRPNRKARRKSR